MLDQLQDRLAQAKHPEAEWFILNRCQENVSLTEAEHLLDWFDAERLDRPLKGMSLADAKRLAQEWVDALVKRGDHIVETEEDIEVLFTTSRGSRFVKLLTKRALQREGCAMRHCLGSMEPGNHYSIRNAKNRSIATMTIEFSGDDETGRHISQLQGKGNGPIHPKYIADTLEVLQFLKIELNSRWMQKLGYTELATEVWEEIDTNWTNVKECTIGGTRYFWLPGGPHLKKKV